MRNGSPQFPSSGMISIQGAREHNLRGINVKIPVGVLTAAIGAPVLLFLLGRLR